MCPKMRINRRWLLLKQRVIVDPARPLYQADHYRWYKKSHGWRRGHAPMAPLIYHAYYYFYYHYILPPSTTTPEVQYTQLQSYVDYYDLLLKLHHCYFSAQVGCPNIICHTYSRGSRVGSSYIKLRPAH